MVAGVTAGLAESNGSLPPGLWLTSLAGWLPRTGIGSGTLRSAIEYGLPLPYLLPAEYAEQACGCLETVLHRPDGRTWSVVGRPSVCLSVSSFSCCCGFAAECPAGWRCQLMLPNMQQQQQHSPVLSSESEQCRINCWRRKLKTDLLHIVQGGPKIWTVCESW